MLRKIISLSLIVFMISSSCAANVYAQETLENTSMEANGNNKYDSFIVKYKKNDKKTRSIKTESYTASVFEKNSEVAVLDFGDEISIEEVKSRIDTNSVEYIQPNYYLELESAENTVDSEHNDEIVTEEDNIINIQKTEDVIVAIIDSNIDVNNTEIKDCLKETSFSEEMDSEGNDTAMDVFDKNTDMVHGTHITGIVAGKSSVTNNIINPNIKIMPLNVFNEGKATTSDIIRAIEYAKENNTKIVNMSFGSTAYNEALKEAIESAPNILFVCAAGNFRRNMDDVPVYPASFDLPNIISVTSINEDKGLSYYSDYGENNVDIAAFGRNVESTAPNNLRVEKNGTSMAAAVVTNAACAIYAENPNVKPEKIKEILVNGSDKLSSLSGYVNRASALNLNDSLAGENKNKIKTVIYDDEFTNAEEKMSYEENIRLFNESAIKDISAGGEHVLVLKEDGTVWAWGRGTEGQLGNGLFENKSAPVKVKGLRNITSIAAGGYHSMATDTEGKLYTWGSSEYSQLGIGTHINRCVPMQVDFSVVEGGYSGIYVNKVEAGLYHSVVQTGVDVFVFGRNDVGQLGYSKWGIEKQRPGLVQCVGTYAYRDVESIGAGGNQTYIVAQAYDPPDVGGLDHYISVLASGEIDDHVIFNWEEIDYSNPTVKCGYTHTYFTLDDSVSEYGRAIGLNEYGELGIINQESGMGYIKKGTFPKNKYKSLECGNYFTLGLRNDGHVDIWGVQINNPSFFEGEMPYTPDAVEMNISNVTNISCGSNYAIALTNDGKIFAIGKNEYGQLGNGTTENSAEFVQVIGTGDSFNANVVGVAAGLTHCMALKSDGTVWAWGRNNKGQLGDGTTESRLNPVQVKSLSNIKQIEAGSEFSMALDFDGNIYLWGDNTYGQLGITTSNSEGVVTENGAAIMSTMPIKLESEQKFSRITAGGGHAMAVDMSDQKCVWSWGRNDKGQLGDRTMVNSAVPQKIPLTYFEEVSAGYEHSLILKHNTSVYSFGNNDFGQLGNSRTAAENVKPMSVITGIEGIATGEYQSFAWDKDGNVFACGYNQWTELGISGNTNLFTFTAVPGLTNIKKIASGNSGSFAIDNDGQLYFWGDKEVFIFDMGESIPANPNILKVDIKEVDDIDVYGNLVILVKKDQTVWTAGNNRYGQLGTGSTFSNNQFIPVVWTSGQNMYPSEGNGTATNPYKIYTEEDYYKIPNKLSACYELMRDIDFGGKEIAALGTNNTYFTGTFDGNNHRLSNFKIRKGYDDASGMFGQTKNATIKNLEIFGADVKGISWVGAIIGYMNGGTLSDSNIMYCTTEDQNGIETKIVGCNVNGIIINCNNDGDKYQVQKASKTVNVSNGQTYKYTLTAANVPYSDMIVFSVQYDSALLRVKTLGISTESVDGDAIVTDNNVKLISNNDGMLTFSITRTKEKNWYGIAANIEFIGIGNGQAQINFDTL